jgi:hypothetical protein
MRSFYDLYSSPNVMKQEELSVHAMKVYRERRGIAPLILKGTR